MTPDLLPADWRAVLADEFDKPYFTALTAFVADERAAHAVYPPAFDVFQAFHATPFDAVEVVLLGQDPYHGEGQAHGLCFSVRPGVKPPPSLVNMFKELQSDQGCPQPRDGCLSVWAARGVLLLNAVMTVRAAMPNSHKNQGWETFTDAVLDALNRRPRPMVFALWGGYAQKKAKRITQTGHRIVQAAHPSPLSASKFRGCKPYTAINAALADIGRPGLYWCLP